MKLSVADDLGRGWVVLRADDGGVRVQQSPRQAAKDLGLRLAQALVPTVLTIACAAYVGSDGAWALVVWPVLVLLLLVCALWALDSLRLGRRVLGPLELGAEQGLVRGVVGPRGRLVGDYFEQRVSEARAEVRAVVCGPLREAVALPLERWRLTVELRDGRTLLGPELVLHPSSPVHRERLEALAQALAAQLQAPLMKP